MPDSVGWQLAHETRPHPSETVCGDAVWVFADESAGELLVALIDGLGHGPRAHDAALACQHSLQTHAQQGMRGPVELIGVVHNEIRATRGVAVSVVRVTPEQLTFAGIGNVNCATTAETFRPFPRDGIVGYRYRSIFLHAAPRHPMLIALYTDGLSAIQLAPFANARINEIPPKLLDAAAPATDDQGVAVLRLP